MKEINGGYQSLFEFLVFKRVPLAQAIDALFYGEKYTPQEDDIKPYSRRYNETPRRPWHDQFIGALQPIASIPHDVQYTFKRYRYPREVLIDIFQPIRGLGHILRGIANGVVAPLFFLIATIKYAFTSKSVNHFFRKIIPHLGRSVSWFIDGLSSILRGVTQLVTTPLTWFLRIPFRIINTSLKGAPLIEENEEVERLMKIGEKAWKDNNEDKIINVTKKLHDVFQRYSSQGQPSNLSSSEETDTYHSVFPGGDIKPEEVDANAVWSNGETKTKRDRIQNCVRYLTLFSKSMNTTSEIEQVTLTSDSGLSSMGSM